jgi:N-formylglutamate amidohydrolase
MTLPFLLSVPHAGLTVPTEVEDICVLSKEDITKDGDEGAAEIYLPLEKHVSALVTTDIARAILDMNRGEYDRRKDGIIKTHTCWDVPVYREPPAEDIIIPLIKKYYRPYHSSLSNLAEGVKLGIDCHTMAEIGPPVGPDQNNVRPHICISNAKTTCPQEWMEILAESLEQVFRTKISINYPFKGGFIVRFHFREIPWVQIELSRASFLSLDEKRDRLLEALFLWNKKLF